MSNLSKGLPRLRVKYEEEVRPSWLKDFFCPLLAVPRFEKIVLSMGLGRYASQSKVLDEAFGNLKKISGQSPVWTNARKSIAGFRLREGSRVGLKVTLRKNRAYEFFDRLVTIALPRVRDYRGGCKTSFDGRGNFSMGIKEYHIFPEIDYDNVVNILGFNIVIGTTALSASDAKMFLQRMGMPFRE